MRAEITRRKEYIVVRALEGHLDVLSSAAYNGGLRKAKAVINAHVPEDFDEDVENFFGQFLEKFEFESEFEDINRNDAVGMMTAADMENASVFEHGEVTAIATAGLVRMGTMNIILLIRDNVSVEGMTNAVITATEAKTAALIDLDVRDMQGSIVTGTPTDAIAVVCHRDDKGIKYCGTATEIGRQIYETTRKAVEDAFSREENMPRSRDILKRLEEVGITLDDIVSSAMMLYIDDDRFSRAEVAEKLKEEIRKECSDMNIALLISSAFYLDEEASKRRGIADDPVNLVADEMIGIDIAEYIGGKKALFNFAYYDRKKPGILSRLSPFFDDIIGGLIAGCMTKILSR